MVPLRGLGSHLGAASQALVGPGLQALQFLRLQHRLLSSLIVVPKLIEEALGLEPMVLFPKREFTDVHPDQ